MVENNCTTTKGRSDRLDFKSDCTESNFLQMHATNNHSDTFSLRFFADDIPVWCLDSKQENPDASGPSCFLVASH